MRPLGPEAPEALCWLCDLGEGPGASVSCSTKQRSHYRPAVRSEQVNTCKALTEARGLQQRQDKPLSSSLSVHECELSINSVLIHSGEQSGPGPRLAAHGAPQTLGQGLLLCRPLRSTRLGIHMVAVGLAPAKDL